MMIHSHELEDSDMQMENKAYGSVPLAQSEDQERLKELYDQLVTSGVSLDENRWLKWQVLVRGIRASVNLYGIVDIEFVYRLINRMPEAYDLLLWEALTLIDLLVQQEDNILKQGPWLYASQVCASEIDVDDLLEEQECLSYWFPSVEALLPYADDGYYEKTAALQALESFLTDRCSSAEHLVRLAGNGLRLVTADDVVDQILDELDTLHESEQDELTSLVTAADAVTRKVRLRGYTPQEELAIVEKQYVLQ